MGDRQCQPPLTRPGQSFLRQPPTSPSPRPLTNSAPLPRFKMVAYTGGAMRVAGSVAVVIDLAGLAVPSQARPIRFGHDPLSGVGHTDSIRVEAGQLVATGVISRDTSGRQSRRVLAGTASRGGPPSARRSRSSSSSGQPEGDRQRPGTHRPGQRRSQGHARRDQFRGSRRCTPARHRRASEQGAQRRMADDPGFNPTVPIHRHRADARAGPRLQPLLRPPASPPSARSAAASTARSKLRPSATTGCHAHRARGPPRPAAPGPSHPRSG